MAHLEPAPASLVDDRANEGIFRVRREAFADPKVFDLEVERIFETTWNYVGHEGQIPSPNDFLTTSLGRQPVLVMRDRAGSVAAFFNSCSHRGTLLCPLKSGNKRVHVCPYHGWTYDSSGGSLGVPQQKEGRYPQSFAQENRGLTPVSRFGSYRGFMFAALHEAAPPLEEYLGDSRRFIDMVVDQAEGELEFIPGTVTYTFDGNWKTQLENGIDMYHFKSTHLSYIELMAGRLHRANGAGSGGPPSGQHGTFDLGHGHAVMWSHRDGIEDIRSFDHDSVRWDHYAEKVGKTRARWMLYNRNLHIFPNVQIIDIQSHVQTIDTPSLQVRVVRPLASDRTEIVSYCLGSKGESADARRQRLRQYEDFFNASGMATSDDNVMFEIAQQGFNALNARPPLGYLRGLNKTDDVTASHAADLAISASGATGPFALGDETGFHGIYHEWSCLMARQS